MNQDLSLSGGGGGGGAVVKCDGQTMTSSSSRLVVSDNGSGDTDNWSYSRLFDDTIDYNNLSTKQWIKLANSLIDDNVWQRMDEEQRQRVHRKMIELRNEDLDRKLAALDELIAAKDDFDGQLKAIPQEIRKPRVHVRDILKLKTLNTKLGYTELQGDNHCDDVYMSYGQSMNTVYGKPVTSANPHASCPPMSPPLTTYCNSCATNLFLTAEAIKRMTVFCGKCSSAKFGGYFECHSCRLYGYYAKSEINTHLAQHFPKYNKH